MEPFGTYAFYYDCLLATLTKTGKSLLSVVLLTHLYLSVQNFVLKKNSSNLQQLRITFGLAPLRASIMPPCVFITSRWCKCGVCCLCPCNFPQSGNQNKLECVAYSITVSHHGRDLERALWQGGGCLFHEWWMIYGVNCSVSIYFSHWCKSVSQPRPTGSLRDPSGSVLARVLCHCGVCFGCEQVTQRHKVCSLIGWAWAR